MAITSGRGTECRGSGSQPARGGISWGDRGRHTNPAPLSHRRTVSRPTVTWYPFPSQNSFLLASPAAGARLRSR